MVDYMKEYLSLLLKIFAFIGVISLLVVVYGYLFKFVEYVHSFNPIVGGGLGTFVLLSIVALIISGFVVVAELHDRGLKI
jgi:uncharacterized membrane protein